MLFSEYERAISTARMAKYLNAFSGDKTKAVKLYKANLKLSSSIFSIISITEVSLRNAINDHYCAIFGTDWLRIESSPSGFLAKKGCEKSRKNLLETIAKLKTNYTPNECVANLSFGFWRYMFASKEFAAAGSNLLNIFPNRISGKNHTDVFQMLEKINRLRNRVAHHQPICFNGNNISVKNTQRIYSEMRKVIVWLNYTSLDFLVDIDNVSSDFTMITKI
jgi:Abi-like protein